MAANLFGFVFCSAFAAFWAWNAWTSERDGRAWGFFGPPKSEAPIIFRFGICTMWFAAAVSEAGAIKFLIDVFHL